jgi:hypothetical protein
LSTIAGLERLVAVSSAAGVTSPTPKTKEREDKCFGYQFRFHLDANEAGEYAIGQEPAALKKQHKYLITVRAAIRLFLSLFRGEANLVRGMFPLIELK